MNTKKIQALTQSILGKSLALLKVGRGFNPLPPLFVQLLLTYRCNLQCPFCYQDRTKSDLLGEMTLEDAQKIEKNLRLVLKFRPQVHFFGGEPVYSRHFMPIFEFFAHKGYPLSITSNGLIIKYVREIVAADKRLDINLSLNTMDDKLAVALLDELKANDTRRRIKVNLNCPIHLENATSLVEKLDRFKDHPISTFVFQHTMFTKHSDSIPDAAVLESQLHELRMRKYKFPVLFNPAIKRGDIKKFYAPGAFPSRRANCFFSWFVLCILPTGDVIPCEEMDIVIGNLKTTELNKIWNNERFIKFREGLIKKGANYPLCYRCCHKIYY